MDCDFQHLLPEMRDLFDAAAEGYDVVVGSRFSRHSVLLNYPFQKIVANRGFHSLAQLVLRRRFRDLTNNLKLMRARGGRAADLCRAGLRGQRRDRAAAAAHGLPVKEVPISWINRTPDMGLVVPPRPGRRRLLAGAARPLEALLSQRRPLPFRVDRAEAANDLASNWVLRAFASRRRAAC